MDLIVIAIEKAVWNSTSRVLDSLSTLPQKARLIYLIWKERHKSLLLCTAYSLVFAGAVGNLIDRISLDYVVDFLDFYIGDKHFPSFNIADSSISIAAGLLILDFILSFKKAGYPHEDEGQGADQKTENQS